MDAREALARALLDEWSHMDEDGWEELLARAGEVLLILADRGWSLHLNQDVLDLTMAVYEHGGTLNERMVEEESRALIAVAETNGLIEAQERDNEGWRVLSLTEAGRRLVDGEEVG